MMEFAIARCGEFAWRVLNGRAPGRVVAVFDHSFYVALGHGLACIGAADMGAGPLNAISTAPAARRLRVGAQVAFNVEDAEIWTPPPPPRWTQATLRAGLAALERLARPRITRDGLAPFVLADPPSDPPSRVVERARGPIRSLAAASLPCDAAGPVSALVGLGPGLTPSGDDFLGGMMIALRAVDRTGAASQLNGLVQESAKARTNPISRAHLAAAGRGAGAAALHDVLGDVLKGNSHDMGRHLDDVAGIGHSSGWDALAGVATMLRAVQSSLCPSPI